MFPAIIPAVETISTAAEVIAAGVAFQALTTAAGHTYAAGKFTRRIVDRTLIPTADFISWVHSQIDWMEVKDSLIEAIVLIACFFYYAGVKARKLWKQAEQALVYVSPEINIESEKPAEQEVQAEKAEPAKQVKLLMPAKDEKPAVPAEQSKSTKKAKSTKSTKSTKPATMAELKKQAKQAGLTNYSKLNKTQLTALLAKHAS